MVVYSLFSLSKGILSMCSSTSVKGFRNFAHVGPITTDGMNRFTQKGENT